MCFEQFFTNSTRKICDILVFMPKNRVNKQRIFQNFPPMKFRSLLAPLTSSNGPTRPSLTVCQTNSSADFIYLIEILIKNFLTKKTAKWRQFLKISTGEFLVSTNRVELLNRSGSASKIWKVKVIIILIGNWQRSESTTKIVWSKMTKWQYFDSSSI
jgi:hypothetical protein